MSPFARLYVARAVSVDRRRDEEDAFEDYIIILCGHDD